MARFNKVASFFDCCFVKNNIKQGVYFLLAYYMAMNNVESIE